MGGGPSKDDSSLYLSDFGDGGDDDDDDDDDAAFATADRLESQIELDYDDDDDNDADEPDSDDNVADDDVRVLELAQARMQRSYETPVSELGYGLVVYEVDAEAPEFARFVEEGCFEFRQIDETLYWMRRQDTDYLVLLAKADNPLVGFCRNLGKQEAKELSQLYHTEPSRLEQLTGDSAPGVLANFIVDVLHERPVVSLQDNSGKEFVVRQPATGAEPPTRANDLSKDIPMPILHRDDRDFEKRLDVATRLLSGTCSVDEWHAIDERSKKFQLRRFERQGETGKFGELPTDGFTTQSPVEDDEEVWCVVNIHYYALFKAYEELCVRNGNLLFHISTHVNSVAEGDYVFPVPAGAAAAYTPEQERAVLREITLRCAEQANRENDVANVQEKLRQKAQQLASLCAQAPADEAKRFDDAFRKDAPGGLPLTRTPFVDTVQLLESIKQCVAVLDQYMGELNRLRNLRVDDGVI